jgi:LCP family protein required for cell wall assembly
MAAPASAGASGGAAAAGVSAAGVSAAGVSAVRTRRSLPQRLLIAFNLAVIVVFLTGAGGLGYFYWRFDRIPRLPVAGLVKPETKQDPQNFLLVGSDTRAFDDSDSEDAEGFGGEDISSGSGRSDTIIIVRVDPRTDQASMVSFPRDLWVEIPGKGHNRINTAFLGDEKAGRSGPELLIETIKVNFDIEINHYAQVDFHGFKGLVDALGGVTIYLAAPVRDWDTSVSPPINQTGLDIAQTGCVELTGDQALSYVRSRHFQTQQPNGRWISDFTSDFGRITRQQDFIRRAMNKVINQDLFNPVKLARLVGVAEKNVKLSSSIKVDDLVKLAKGFRSLSSDTLAQYQLPVYPTNEGLASVVKFEPDKAAEREAVFDVFRGIDRAAIDALVQPSSVTVRVLNGSGVAGQAGEVAVALRAQLFATLDPGNAQRTPQTVIRYGPGQEAKAKLLERYLVAGAVLESQSALEGVDLLLVTGTDYAGVLTAPRTEAPPVTTTTSTTIGTTSTTIAGATVESSVPAC